MKASAIIVAGGSGKRMGTDVPKQLLKLGGSTILERTLRPFIQCRDISDIIIVTEDSILKDVTQIVRDGFNRKTAPPITVVQGGAERQDSVWNGLKAVPDDGEVVVIHDAVRPFITAGLITECVVSAMKNGAVSVMRPLKETVKVVADNIVIETLDRSKLWITQTPQAFRTELIREAHIRAREDTVTGTDDCMLVERLGHSVYCIEGTDLNIKITTPADLEFAGTILTRFHDGEN